VKQALAIDDRTGTTFWRDAIAKEMRNVMPAFEFRDDNQMPVGYKLIDCHMIFDIKSDLTRKARFVAGGNQTEEPSESVYSSVVSRDSIRIAFTIAALNGLKILAGDIQNAYLNAPTKERCYTIAGPEFGKDYEKRPVMIVRALYGLRSSGARWRDHMASTLRTLGFKGCLADPDIWLRPACKADGTKYYEYVLIYVDDILAISEEPQKVMDAIGKHYTLKPGSVRPPNEYLGAQIKPYRPDPDDDCTCWSMSCDKYVKRAIEEVQRTLAEVGDQLKGKAMTPTSHGYRPELDASPELDDRRANYYQGLIGVLRWMVELGRIDIMVGVAMLSCFLAAPREGHLNQVYHIFDYLKCHERSSLVFDPQNMPLDESRFVARDWSEYYPDAQEAIPLNAPEPRGNSVTMSCFVDADHAGCRVTRRSHTGIIIYVQGAPIIWYSKRQNTVESSTFGSEFIAMKTAIEQIEALRYKLRMMGIAIDGPANVFCDNEAVFKNCVHPESTIKKKHNSIAYHRTREAQASGTVRIAWEPGETNRADILTKLLDGKRLKVLIRMILR
jgi:Reverse transcriptase (RNA-dependent DNA polymerase)